MKVGLAGQGAFGIKHLEAIRNIPGIEVITLTGGNQESTKEVAQKFGIPHYTGDLAESLKQPGLEAMILATPTQQSVTASLAAQVAEVRPASVSVVVTWNGTCSGAAAGANWYGNLSLEEPATGGSIYLGGVSSASGSTTQVVARTDRERSLSPLLRISCSSTAV